MALVYLSNGSLVLTEQVIALEFHRVLPYEIQWNNNPRIGAHCFAQKAPKIFRATQPPKVRGAAAALPYERRTVNGNISDGGCASDSLAGAVACSWYCSDRGGSGNGCVCCSSEQALEVAVALDGTFLP